MNIIKVLTGSLITTALLAGSVSPVFAHDNGGKGGRGNHGSHGVSSLVNAGTLTQAQADAFSNAMKTKLDAKFASKLNTVLADLVSKNTLTQAKADAIKVVANNKKGLRDLVSAGTITQSEAQAVHAALHGLPKEDVATLRDQVLSELVASNTLTQTQADAIKSAKQNWVKRLGKHHGASIGNANSASLTF
jgi:Asp-tRNA(Asn)/Glu-tRNA(Gln) amidotransferase B subunit